MASPRVDHYSAHSKWVPPPPSSDDNSRVGRPQLQPLKHTPSHQSSAFPARKSASQSSFPSPYGPASGPSIAHQRDLYNIKYNQFLDLASRAEQELSRDLEKCTSSSDIDNAMNKYHKAMAAIIEEAQPELDELEQSVSGNNSSRDSEEDEHGHELPAQWLEDSEEPRPSSPLGLAAGVFSSVRDYERESGHFQRAPPTTENDENYRASMRRRNRERQSSETVTQQASIKLANLKNELEHTASSPVGINGPSRAVDNPRMRTSGSVTPIRPSMDAINRLPSPNGQPRSRPRPPGAHLNAPEWRKSVHLKMEGAKQQEAYRRRHVDIEMEQQKTILQTFEARQRGGSVGSSDRSTPIGAHPRNVVGFAHGTPPERSMLPNSPPSPQAPIRARTSQPLLQAHAQAQAQAQASRNFGASPPERQQFSSTSPSKRFQMSTSVDTVDYSAEEDGSDDDDTTESDQRPSRPGNKPGAIPIPKHSESSPQGRRGSTPMKVGGTPTTPTARGMFPQNLRSMQSTASFASASTNSSTTSSQRSSGAWSIHSSTSSTGTYVPSEPPRSRRPSATSNTNQASAQSNSFTEGTTPPSQPLWYGGNIPTTGSGAAINYAAQSGSLSRAATLPIPVGGFGPLGSNAYNTGSISQGRGPQRQASIPTMFGPGSSPTNHGTIPNGPTVSGTTASIPIPARNSSAAADNHWNSLHPSSGPTGSGGLKGPPALPHNRPQNGPITPTHTPPIPSQRPTPNLQSSAVSSYFGTNGDNAASTPTTSIPEAKEENEKAKDAEKDHEKDHEKDKDKDKEKLKDVPEEKPELAPKRKTKQQKKAEKANAEKKRLEEERQREEERQKEEQRAKEEEKRLLEEQRAKEERLRAEQEEKERQEAKARRDAEEQQQQQHRRQESRRKEDDRKQKAKRQEEQRREQQRRADDERREKERKEAEEEERLRANRLREQRKLVRLREEEFVKEERRLENVQKRLAEDQRRLLEMQKRLTEEEKQWKEDSRKLKIEKMKFQQEQLSLKIKSMEEDNGSVSSQQSDIESHIDDSPLTDRPSRMHSTLHTPIDEVYPSNEEELEEDDGGHTPSASENETDDGEEQAARYTPGHVSESGESDLSPETVAVLQAVEEADRLEAEQFARAMWEQQRRDGEAAAARQRQIDEEYRHRQIEEEQQAIREQLAREERIRQENERLTEQFLNRERVTHMAGGLPQRTMEAWTAYDDKWKKLQAQISNPSFVLTWAKMPWPMLNPPSGPEAITKNMISNFILSQYHSPGKGRKERIREALLRWHPDRFESRYLCKVPEGPERDRVKEGVGNVVRYLNELSPKDS